MIELVGEFGIEALPQEAKTEEVLSVLMAERHKINAKQEIIQRHREAPLTAKRLRQLILYTTNNPYEADKAEAFFINEETRQERM